MAPSKGYMVDITLSEYPVKGPIKPLSIGTLTADKNIFKTSGHLCGLALAEATGTNAATIGLYNGLDVNGELIAPINLNPNESIRDWFGFFGVYFDVGLFAHLASGSVYGTVWWRP
jgi:hypothetical protein